MYNFAQILCFFFFNKLFLQLYVKKWNGLRWRLITVQNSSFVLIKSSFKLSSSTLLISCSMKQMVEFRRFCLLPFSLLSSSSRRAFSALLVFDNIIYLTLCTPLDNFVQHIKQRIQQRFLHSVLHDDVHWCDWRMTRLNFTVFRFKLAYWRLFWET